MADSDAYHDHRFGDVRCGVQCIVPPHMIEALLLRGTERQKRMARSLERQADAVLVERLRETPRTAYKPAPILPLDIVPALRREVYDGQGKAALPGVLARAEGDPASGDATVDATYDGVGHTFRLYCEVFRRNSLDGRGRPIVSTVHHRRSYNNAFWNGEQMAIGDGDGQLFVGFTVPSVIGHELSHGVVQFSGGLTYRDQPGALNESFCDVFGALCEQFAARQEVAEASWLIGEGVFGPEVGGTAIRSLRAPGTAYDDEVLGKDPQPFHLDGYVATTADNGGVHINSGIPNHAFYLLAQYLGGFAWERAGMIWYDTMQAMRDPFPTFTDWADKTVEMARARYGASSVEVLMTRRAWKCVGIDV